MMFGIKLTLDELSREEQSNLALLLTERIAYMEQAIELNKLRVQYLQNPTPQNKERVDDFNAAVIMPLRSKLSEDMKDALAESIDIDGLKHLMPMMLAGVLQSVNLPYLLAVLGIEADNVEKLVAKVREIIKSEF